MRAAGAGGGGARGAGDILSFEADRRAINITINSIGTELTRDDRRKLYPALGALHPYGQAELMAADDVEQVRAAVDKYPQFASLFAKFSYGDNTMLDRIFYEEEVKRMVLMFEQQFHYGVYYGYLRLREQEVRNLMWVAECVSQDQKGRIHDGIVLIA